MRIGIMLRTIDESGGIGVYTRNITEELLKIDQENEYVLYFRTPRHFGRYAEYPNATEKLLETPFKPLWDQYIIPREARQDRIDLIFHPKFTVPFFTKARTVMVVHGADWYIPPYHKVYNRLDTMYIKAFMPLYFKKSDFVISVSDYSTRGYVQAMPRFKDKIGTIYFAPNRGFKRVEDPVVLETARAKYNLPEHFLLTVIRYDPGRKKHRKNFRNMVKGFARCREKYGIPHKWIVVGKNCEKYGEETDLAALGVEEDVIFPGYVEQEDLPALYTLADLYLYATIIEAFPIPITEAMSCGCPIVTSKGTGLEELAGEAARLVDPYDIDEIAENIYQVLGDADCQKRLTRNGLERAQLFDWEKCARETLEVFERCVDGKIASYAGN